ncbi:membrane protein insertion efficiency factor YidD [Chloroflexota bacterium]
MKRFALKIIKFYQMTISQVMLPSCRYLPTCSQYTYEAVEKFGFFRGAWLGMRRISRCHPFHPGGYDPIP